MNRCLVIFTSMHAAESAATTTSSGGEHWFRNIFPKVPSSCKPKQSQIATVARRQYLLPKQACNSYNKLDATSSSFQKNNQIRLLSTRGGVISNNDENNTNTDDVTTSPYKVDLQTATTSTKYTVLSQPAPGSPFHYAFPVHDLQIAKEFYGTILGCTEGRSSTKWQDYSLHGHQIVAHWVGSDYRCQDYYNPVDGDEVPVPHMGLALTVEQFHDLADRLRKADIKFIIEPHLRFEGMPGEQYTMFFKDPSGNNLEFKAMTKPENLFAKYNVDDK